MSRNTELSTREKNLLVTFIWYQRHTLSVNQTCSCFSAPLHVAKFIIICLINELHGEAGLLLWRTWFWLQALISGNSGLPVTPVPGALKPSGFCRHQHRHGTHNACRHTLLFIKTNIKQVCIVSQRGEKKSESKGIKLTLLRTLLQVAFHGCYSCYLQVYFNDPLCYT